MTDDTVAAASTETVRVDGVDYSLREVPLPTHDIVLKSKTHLLGALDLPALVEDLGRVGAFVRIAYNGVAGCTGLQIQVQRIGYEITRLTDKSALTVSKFARASDDVLQNLKCAYGFLLDGLEDMAVETFIQQGHVADMMSKAAKELQEDFEGAAKSVQTCLEETQREKGRKKEDKTKFEQERRDYETKQAEAEIARMEASVYLGKAENLYQEARSREDRILEEEFSIKKELIGALSGIAKTGVNLVSMKFVSKTVYQVVSAVNGVKPDSDDEKKKDTGSAAKEAMQSAKEEKMRHLEEIRKQQDARLQALKAIAVMAKKIETCNGEADFAEVTIVSLHSAIGGLKHLSDIMAQASLFWEQVSSHTQAMANGRLKKIVEKARTVTDEEKRMKIWTSSSFKESAIREYADWVALADVCSLYMSQIRDTQRDLHAYLRENPTTEESMRNVRQLAIEFGRDLQQAQDRIAFDRRATNEQQIKALTAPSAE